MERDTAAMNQKLFQMLNICRWADVSRGYIRRKTEECAHKGGAFIPVGRGFYLEIPPNLEVWEVLQLIYLARVYAYLRTIKHRLVLCGLTAAFLVGYSIDSPMPNEITVYQNRGSRKITRIGPHASVNGEYRFHYGRHVITVRDTAVRRFANRPEGKVLNHRGFPVTDARITFIDSLRAGYTLDAFASLNEQLRRACEVHRYWVKEKTGLVNDRAQKQIAGFAQAMEIQRGRKGMRRARQLLREITPWIESVLESRAIWLLRKLGLQVFVLQKKIRSGRYTFYLDLWIPELNLAIEIDGLIKYTDPKYLNEQHRRDRVLYDRGISVLHLTRSDLRSVATLREKLYRDAPQLLQLIDPTGLAA